MRTATNLLLLNGMLLASAFAGHKDRDWKTAHVLDSTVSLQRYVTGATTQTNGSSTTFGEANATAVTAGGFTTANGTSAATTTGSSTSTTRLESVTIQASELVLVSDGFLYIVQDERRRGGPLLETMIANHRHGCRFVVGDDVKYAQEKGSLWVLDADGKECKVAILRQERR
jgi:hypothetical protein